MSKVVIAGDASGTGTFTISAPNGNTDRTLVLPDEAGTIDTLQRAGNVLQVVQGTTSTSSSTTSTSYQQSLLTASITPTSATSKIFVLFTTTVVQTTQGNGVAATIYRDNATNLGGGTESALSMFENQYPGGYVWVPSAGNVLDTPSTTSTTSYTLYYKAVTGGTVVVNWAANKATITLMEIAA